jgi:hypothetical protein
LSDEFTAILTLGVAAIAYQQWRASRHEISIDKYYDRLEEANKRLEPLGYASKEKLHCYIELDKLEYVIVKYELGFISAKLMMRAIDNFQFHCLTTKNFQNLVIEIFNESAYLEETKIVAQVVRTVCGTLKNSNAVKI